MAVSSGPLVVRDGGVASGEVVKPLARRARHGPNPRVHVPFGARVTVVVRARFLADAGDAGTVAVHAGGKPLARMAGPANESSKRHVGVS